MYSESLLRLLGEYETIDVLVSKSSISGQFDHFLEHLTHSKAVYTASKVYLWYGIWYFANNLNKIILPENVF